SAMAHGHDPDPQKALQIAVAAMTASLTLDAERSTLYYDLVLVSLSEATRKRLQSMDPAKYEFQSEFAKRYLSQGRAEGEARGEARGETKVLLKQLTLKFGPLPAGIIDQVQSAPTQQLELWAERILSAKTLGEVLG
ncbi:MAG TPA: DUF4351 domain-containing protein, partial [Polyangiales bacterium]